MQPELAWRGKTNLAAPLDLFGLTQANQHWSAAEAEAEVEAVVVVAAAVAG